MAITQADIVKWLGRPLTTTESTNFASNLNIAKSYLEQLLCTTLDCGTYSAMVYDARDGFRTVFTDYFTGDPVVTINGATVTDCSARFFDNRNTAIKNSIVFDSVLDAEEVSIEALWGLKPLPDDLGSVLAQLFATAGKPYKATGDVKSKRVEDFAITFGDRTDVQTIADNNSAIINKYALCGVINMTSGEVCRWT